MIMSSYFSHFSHIFFTLFSHFFHARFHTSFHLPNLVETHNASCYIFTMTMDSVFVSIFNVFTHHSRNMLRSRCDSVGCLRLINIHYESGQVNNNNKHSRGSAGPAGPKSGSSNYDPASQNQFPM